MPITVFLIVFPFLCAPFIYCIKEPKIRDHIMYAGVALIMAAVFLLAGQWLANGTKVMSYYPETDMIDHIILVVEIGLMCLITFLSFKYRKYWVSLLSIIPTLLIAWFELKGPEMEPMNHIYVDHLSILMCLIIGFIGGLIIIYAVGYMYGYHNHHKEYADRRQYFFALLFIFIGAMFGFVLSSNLLWIDLFWEITSVCSFLLIGYTKTEEAVNNSFRALWMNLLGGTVLAFGIVYFGCSVGTVSIHDLVLFGNMQNAAAVIPIACIAFAALTKAAQMPFSTWLMGAMVAPTPSSALLHSATMVKAGIYILLRLAPAMRDTLTGNMVSFVGGFTFFVASILAISQNDGKRVLAFSTISNLGLMVACCGVGMPETIWAAVFLMMFHSISKSLLFQTVGAVENRIGSRDIENMHGLLYRLPSLATFMFIGIAGMFLAPFGMLISKWSALKAAVDDGNILLVLFIAFGSATTGLYWTKWMGKLISRSHRGSAKTDEITQKSQKLSLRVHAGMMIMLCVLLPIISQVFVDPLLIEMFGTYTDVLSLPILIIMVVIFLFIFMVPVVSFTYTRHQESSVKLSYMSGVNVGNNNQFVNSLGHNNKLWLSNLYFTDFIRPERTMKLSQLVASGWILILFCMILGGTIL